VDAFIESHAVVYVIEQNRDGQLRSLLILETNAEKRKLVPILHYDGMPMTARFVTDAVLAHVQTTATHSTASRGH
jgi:2-oxoglutarate ferredoxin oxidoreductase subunit alpha